MADSQLKALLAAWQRYGTKNQVHHQKRQQFREGVAVDWNAKIGCPLQRFSWQSQVFSMFPFLYGGKIVDEIGFDHNLFEEHEGRAVLMETSGYD